MLAHVRFAASGGHTKVDRLVISGAVGALEGLLEWEPEVAPRFAAIVCHPHPLYGGTMHNKVVFRAAKAAIGLGAPALRFNFRGVGKSGGHFDYGVGEYDDARAALDYLETRLPHVPVCMMGFSFGSSVGLALGAADSRVVALVGLGLPVASTNFDFLRSVAKPKLIVQGSDDVYAPRPRAQGMFDSLDEPKRIHWVEGADHFFTDRLEEVQRVIGSFLEEVFDVQPS